MANANNYKREIDRNTIILEDFNTPHTPMNRSYRKLSYRSYRKLSYRSYRKLSRKQKP